MQNKMYIYLTVMRTLSMLGLPGRHLDPEGVGDQGESVGEVVGVRSCRKNHGNYQKGHSTLSFYGRGEVETKINIKNFLRLMVFFIYM